MYKKAGTIIFCLILMLPVFASAATYWSITASTSPSALKSNLTPARPANFGNYTTPNGGSATNIINNTVTSVDYLVRVPAGYTVANVKVDGVIKGSSAGTYTVSKGTKVSHTIAVTYAILKYIITTNDVSLGSISLSKTYSTTADIRVTPFSGNQLYGATIDGVTYPLAAGLPSFVTMTGDASGAVYTFNTGSHTMQGVFVVAPAASAVISTPSQTVNMGTTGIAIDGSASTSNVADTSYSWTSTCGTVTPTAPNAKTATYSAPAAPGNCTVILTVSALGVSPNPQATVTFTISDPVATATNLCLACHKPDPANPGRTTGGPDATAFIGSVHDLARKTCSDCHNPERTLSHSYLYLPDMANICRNCHTDAQGNVPNHAFAIGANTCVSCHNPHTGRGAACDGCHDSPPATASHVKHYGGIVAQARYGDIRITQAFGNYSTKYIFGCGNCHPMDAAKHGNSLIDIELYNPLAPAGSLKAMNPASAAYVAGDTLFTDSRGLDYTKGTCSSVYCHSYNDWTTTAAIPESDPDWESKTVKTRIYRDITWGGASLGCSGCHGNPTQTSYPGNDGGAGDSHSWIDPYGYQNLHTWNMFGDPVSCSYCHNETVKQLNTFTVDGNGINIQSEVPISNFSKHVNGSNDVSFDKLNPYVYPNDGSHSLANATYDPGTKNCSNVSCHINQTTVKWGTPYRWYWYGTECDSCHQYGY